MIKIISWNVNGIRSIITKKYFILIKKYNADIICLSETKLSHSSLDNILLESKIKEIFPEYKYIYWSNSETKKGYCGMAIISKIKPLNVYYNLFDNPIKKYHTTGRLIIIELKKYYLVNVYTPNSGEGLINLPFRNIWDKKFLEYMNKLKNIKPLIICGDLNVAHNEIDVSYPLKRKNTACFTLLERNNFSNLLKKIKLIDTFRYLYPTKQQFSFWSYRSKARLINAGWRLDYFLLSIKLLKSLKYSEILPILGSDHAPIILILY